MRIGYIKDENGKLVRKFVKEDEVGKDPDVLFLVSAHLGDYTYADEDNIEEAKAALLENMFNAIRELAKNDKFWIVKTVDDRWNDFQNSVLSEMHKMTREEWLGHQYQEVKDGKLTIGCRIDFPEMEGYYTWEEAERLQKQYDACVSDKWM